jgi:hypothetical protein
VLTGCSRKEGSINQRLGLDDEACTPGAALDLSGSFGGFKCTHTVMTFKANLSIIIAHSEGKELRH